MSVTKGGSVKTASKSVVANRDILALAIEQGFDLIAGFEPRKDHIYTVTRAISARVNQNFDGFPSAELKKSYITFLGKPVFVNHLNDDPTKARGRVVGARYVENGVDKYIEVIQEVDAKRFPKLAKELVESGLDSVSMGCSAERTICSFCGNTATGMFDMCTHVLNSKGKTLRRQGKSGQMEDVLVYEECRDLGFFELSYVFDPADETAVVSNLVMANKTGATFSDPWIDDDSEWREDDPKFLDYMDMTHDEILALSEDRYQQLLNEWQRSKGGWNKGGRKKVAAFQNGTGNRVWCDLPGCNRWTLYDSDRYDSEWVNGGGQLRTYDYCSHAHRDQYEQAHPNWELEAAIANPIKFHALQIQAYGEVEAPEAIDTLRDDSDEQEEEFHQYVESPPGLADPDLDKARELDRRDEMGEGYEDMSNYLQDEVAEGNPLNEDMLDDPGAVDALGDQLGVPEELDPITGEPVEPEAEIDPITGEPVEPEIDPLTGEPVEPEAEVDPITGEPVEPEVDPITGEPVEPEMIDPVTGEPVSEENSPDEVMPFDAEDEDNPFKTDEQSVVPVEKADDAKDADALAVEDPTAKDPDLVDPEDPAFGEQAPPKAPAAPKSAPPKAEPKKQEGPAKTPGKSPPVKQPTTNETAPKPPKPDEVAPASPPKIDKPNNKSPEEHAKDKAENDSGSDKDTDPDDDVMKDPGDAGSEDSADDAEKVDDSDELTGLAEQLGISEDDLLQLDPEDLIQLLDADGPEASDNKEKKMPSANKAAARKENTMSRDSLAQRGRVASRGRVADQSRNDQGEMEETFLTQTPPAEPVETAEGEDINNTEENLVARIRADQAQLLALRKKGKRKQADGGFLGDGASAGDTAEKVDPPLSGTDEQELKGDMESADPDDGVQETQPKDASRRARVANRRKQDFAAWVNKTSRKRVSQANSVGELRTWVNAYCREAGIKPEVMYPLVKGVVMALRKRAADDDEGTSGGKKAEIPDFIQEKIDGKDDGDKKESQRRAARRRKVADEKLDVAAPDGRVDVERPTADDTSDDAQAAQYDKDDFGQNAADDKADPDLSTNQNWAPGKGKSSAWKQASGVNAVRLARAYINAGIEQEDQEWVLASQFEKMSAAVVNDRLALLDRVIEARPTPARTARKTAGTRGVRPASLPQNLSNRAAPPQQRVAANDSSTDSDLFL